MSDVLTKTYFNGINPLDELDSIMKKSGFNVNNTLKQVEAITGIKANTLRQRINRGTLKATKVGRDWFINSKELKKLLEK